MLKRHLSLRGRLSRGTFAWMLVAALLACGLLVAGGTANAEPVVGQPAPPFELAGSDGETYALSQFVGKRGVVLAWFPKAFTPG